MGHDTALQFKRGVGGIIGRAFIFSALLIDPLGNMRGAQTGNGLHFAEKIVEDIPPVTKHVDNDSAVIFLPVIPARALRLDARALENPVAELAANRENFAEEAGFLQTL